MNPAKPKLTQDQVDTMRAERKAGATYNALAVKYGICATHCGRICNGERWPKKRSHCGFVSRKRSTCS
jgi:hypothetical protein